MLFKSYLPKEVVDVLFTEFFQEVQPVLTSQQKLSVVDIEQDDDGWYIEAAVEQEHFDA